MRACHFLKVIIKQNVRVMGQNIAPVEDIPPVVPPVEEAGHGGAGLCFSGRPLLPLRARREILPSSTLSLRIPSRRLSSLPQITRSTNWIEVSAFVASSATGHSFATTTLLCIWLSRNKRPARELTSPQRNDQATFRTTMQSSCPWQGHTVVYGGPAMSQATICWGC